MPRKSHFIPAGAYLSNVMKNTIHLGVDIGENMRKKMGVPLLPAIVPVFDLSKCGGGTVSIKSTPAGVTIIAEWQERNEDDDL